MENIKFDSQQKYSGVNKYGHYQFGNRTCLYCKSDDTWVEDYTFLPENITEKVIMCTCGGKMPLNNL